MKAPTILTAGHTDALTYAVEHLKRQGCRIVTAPSDAVTHLLLPVPSFEPNGSVKGGGALAPLLEQLPEDVTVLGGNLQSLANRCRVTDLLQDPYYLAHNAAITAHCALKLALSVTQAPVHAQPILVLGWGRIGKCLAQLLRGVGADVTVAARKESDRAILEALGYRASAFPPTVKPYRVVFNTAPEPVLSREQAAQLPASCIMIDLASRQGILGENVIWARGLPNKDAPEASGELIARTVLRLIREKE